MHPVVLRVPHLAVRFGVSTWDVLEAAAALGLPLSPFSRVPVDRLAALEQEIQTALLQRGEEEGLPAAEDEEELFDDELDEVEDVEDIDEDDFEEEDSCHGGTGGGWRVDPGEAREDELLYERDADDLGPEDFEAEDYSDPDYWAEPEDYSSY